MQYSSSDRTLALAGIFQATALVRQIARNGMADSQALETSIDSIFRRDADNVEAVYGSAKNLVLGLKSLRTQLDKRTAVKEIELTKYVLGIMYLERQLAKHPALLNRIAAGIEKAHGQADYFSLMHANVLSSLADLYSDTVSKLMPRIIVNGEHMHLSNPDNAAKIRALLLAAIRSAVLWHQCGGSRIKLIFSRKAITREVESILARPD